MAIDIQTETLIGFAEAASRLPKTPAGVPVHPKTIARWTTVGFGGVRLEWLRIGSRRVTSVEACQRFFDAISQVEPHARGGRNPNRIAAVKAAAKRAAANKAVRAKLQERGLM